MIKIKSKIINTLTAYVIGAAAFVAVPAMATTVQVQTILGDFEINLYDKATPATVANFLGYVNAGDYNDTYFHRSVTGFVLQGGGYKVEADQQFETMPPVINEPKFSNVRGTIAMAKLGGNPNSATSQWFINLSDNSGNLDNQNGGFTVFGEVVGQGMQVVDALAALPKFRVNGQSDFPLANYTAEDASNGVAIEPRDNLVIVSQVVVLDASPDTADNLSPVEARKPAAAQKKKSSAVQWWLLMGVLIFVGLRMRASINTDIIK